MCDKTKNREYTCPACGDNICVCEADDFWRAHCQTCNWEIGPYGSKAETYKWLKKIIKLNKRLEKKYHRVFLKTTKKHWDKTKE